LINDFEKYGKDRSKIADWERKPRNVTRKKVEQIKEKDSTTNQSINGLPEQQITQTNLVKSEIPLSSEQKFVIFHPPLLKSKDIVRVEGYINYLKTSIAEDDETKDKTKKNDGG
jgi:hypothetical protein